MAVGHSYPESGGVNESAVHTDLVCDLRLGGRIVVDGEDSPGRREVRRLATTSCIYTAGGDYPFGIGEPASRKNQAVKATIASTTEPISTASTTVVVPSGTELSRMLFSQAGRIGVSRLVPVILCRGG